ncbi:hypothetical protein SCOCK_280049 [Actinacidiphila cocklensis]|uniref:Uncharacterized protein n=1 Tax=Actinacidiphila cocklensis TaxID=887465 RepID=A0A9W4E7J2_9ACTN|nr:hypothetical protein SCOCK_280049 [Actinacidiphila cocklensis]
MVAAGAGHPRLPDPRRRHPRPRAPTAGAGVRGLLQRLLPGPRRRRRLLQRARQRHPVPGRHRAAQGQPRDGGLPLARTVLPGSDVHHAAGQLLAADAALQAAAGRLRRPRPAGRPRPAARGLGGDRAGVDRRRAARGLRRQGADGHAARQRPGAAGAGRTGARGNAAADLHQQRGHHPQRPGRGRHRRREPRQVPQEPGDGAQLGPAPGRVRPVQGHRHLPAGHQRAALPAGEGRPGRRLRDRRKLAARGDGGAGRHRRLPARQHPHLPLTSALPHHRLT